jgi:hypothetical protein
LLLTLPLAATLLLMRNWYFAHNYLQVALQIFIGFLPYGLGLAWATWTKRAWRVGKLSSAPPDEVAVAFIDTLQGQP